jgi:hypothetical protein
MKQLLAGVVAAGLLSAAAPAAHAQAGIEALTPMGVSASSTLKGKKDKYAAWRVFDNDAVEAGGSDMSSATGTYYTTAWCEGKKDEGIGESLELAGDDLSFTTITIAAGFWKSEALWAKNNRPTKLTITVTGHDDQERTFDLDVPSDMEEAELNPGELVDAQDIKIAFAAVDKGKVNDTCISDVMISKGDTTLRPAMINLGADQDFQTMLAALSDGLTNCTGDAINTYVHFPLSYKSLGDPSGMAKPVKKKWKKAKDLLKSCKKGQAPSFAGDINYAWVITEGPDKLEYRYAGNEMGAAWLHFTYYYNDDATSGTWKLSGADVTAP